MITWLFSKLIFRGKQIKSALISNILSFSYIYIWVLLLRLDTNRWLLKGDQNLIRVLLLLKIIVIFTQPQSSYLLTFKYLFSLFSWIWKWFFNCVQDFTNYRIKIYLLSVVSWNCALQAYLKYLPCYNCIIFKNNFLINNYIFWTE